MADKKKTYEAEFVVDRQTKGALRYDEVITDMPAGVGKLYLKKWIANRLGDGQFPSKVKMTVEVVETGGAIPDMA
jgi:hypothetical protein